MNPDGWQLLEAGEYKEAVNAFGRTLDNLRVEGAIEPVVRVAEADLAMAYVFLGNSDLSLPILDRLLQSQFVATSSYAVTGIARWILGMRHEAVSHWQKGMGCDYADASGGMELPLLLYYAAVRDPAVFAVSKAKELAKKATTHPWAECWPGPLGKYILGIIDEREARRCAIFKNDIVSARQKAQVDFYVGIRLLEADKIKGFRDQMQHCARIPNWHLANEFYLARFEADSN